MSRIYTDVNISIDLSVVDAVSVVKGGDNGWVYIGTNVLSVENVSDLKDAFDEYHENKADAGKAKEEMFKNISEKVTAYWEQVQEDRAEHKKKMEELEKSGFGGRVVAGMPFPVSEELEESEEN